MAGADAQSGEGEVSAKCLACRASPTVFETKAFLMGYISGVIDGSQNFVGLREREFCGEHLALYQTLAAKAKEAIGR